MTSERGGASEGGGATSGGDGVALPVGVAVALHLAFVALIVVPALGVPGEDFASYHNAARIALSGGDPYDGAAMTALGNAHAPGYPVHPFIYPPPFLLAVLWAGVLDPLVGWRLFVLGIEALALASLALWVRWARGVDRSVVLGVVFGFAAFPAVWVNLLAGQANWLIVALTFAGLLLAARGREVLGGALLGTAVIFKLSPALLVAWWAWRGQWRAALAALGACAAWTVASLPVAPVAVHVRFWTEILGEMSRGDYHGLVVPLTTVDNYAPAAKFALLFPSSNPGLSPAAAMATRVATLLLVGAAAWAVRPVPKDAWQSAAQVALLCAVGALVPAYVFEHHLIWMIPGFALLLGGLATGRLGRPWLAAAALSAVALLVPLAPLKPPDLVTRAPWLLALELVQLAGLLSIPLACLALAASSGRRSLLTV